MGLKFCFVREPATDVASPQHIDLSAGADWVSVGADREELRCYPRRRGRGETPCCHASGGAAGRVVEVTPLKPESEIPRRNVSFGACRTTARDWASPSRSARRNNWFSKSLPPIPIRKAIGSPQLYYANCWETLKVYTL